MDYRDELIYDFDSKLPKVLIGGNQLSISNVKRIVLLTENELTVDNGKKYTSVKGVGLTIEEIDDGRVLITGEIEKVEFYKEH